VAWCCNPRCEPGLKVQFRSVHHPWQTSRVRSFAGGQEQVAQPDAVLGVSTDPTSKLLPADHWLQTNHEYLWGFEAGTVLRLALWLDEVFHRVRTTWTLWVLVMHQCLGMNLRPDWHTRRHNVRSHFLAGLRDGSQGEIILPEPSIVSPPAILDLGKLLIRPRRTEANAP